MHTNYATDDEIFQDSRGYVRNDDKGYRSYSEPIFGNELVRVDRKQKILYRQNDDDDESLIVMNGGQSRRRGDLRKEGAAGKYSLIILKALVT